MKEGTTLEGTQGDMPVEQASGTRVRKRRGHKIKATAPLSGLAKLTLAALVGAAIGVLVGVVEGLVKLDALFLPPLVVGTLYLGTAGLIATRIRWMPAVGALYATIMLIGATTLGASSVFLRLTHPADVLGFSEIWVQMTCTLIAAVVGIAATIQAIVQREGV